MSIGTGAGPSDLQDFTHDFVFVHIPFRSAFGVRRSAFGVRRSAFGVRRSAFGKIVGDKAKLSRKFVGSCRRGIGKIDYLDKSLVEKGEKFFKSLAGFSTPGFPPSLGQPLQTGSRFLPEKEFLNFL
jgi:hypothetical protein